MSKILDRKKDRQKEVYRNKRRSSETNSALNLGWVTGDGNAEAVWTGVFYHIKVLGLREMGANQALSFMSFVRTALGKLCKGHS